MTDPGALLGGAAAVLLAAAFAIRQVATARKDRPSASIRSEMLIEQTALKLDTTNGTLAEILEALHGIAESFDRLPNTQTLDAQVKQLRLDVRHDLRNELAAPVLMLGELHANLERRSKNR